MKQLIRRLRAFGYWLLVIPMLITVVFATSTQNCPGNCAHQAAIGSTHYDTLTQAVSTTQAGETVTLLQNVTMSDTLLLQKALTLDLGGRTLTGTLRCKADAVLQNGTLTAQTASPVQVENCSFTAEKDLVLIAQGQQPAITATASQDSQWAVFLCPDTSVSGHTALQAEGSGNLDLSGGVVSTTADCFVLALNPETKLNLALVGGTVSSREGEVLHFLADSTTALPSQFVTGGTYAPLPQAYIPDTCQITKNADGSGTVVSTYTLSFDPDGGTGTMAAVTLENTAPVSLPQCAFTAPEGTIFQAWQIDGQTYAPGSTYVLRTDVTLKALWTAHVHTGGQATCTNQAICDSCGAAYGNLGSHKLASVNFRSPTCTDSGIHSHEKCTVCGQRYSGGKAVSTSSLTIAALGHSLETVTEVPATCVEPGTVVHEICITCGSLLLDGVTVTEDALVLPAVGHVMRSVAATAATCTNSGIAAHEVCDLCGYLEQNGAPVVADTLTTALASHVLSDWATDETAHWKTCVDCGEVFRWAPHGDLDRDGSCDDCGSAVAIPELPAEPEEAGFSWLFLMPMAAAVLIAILLLVRKARRAV